MNDLDNYPKPSLTVDVVIFTIIDDELKVLLIKRSIQPFLGQWTLPGGFIKLHESLKETALRKLEQKTGINKVYLEQLYTFGEPKRDPRGRVISVAYYALVDSTKIKPHLTGKVGVEDVRWFAIDELPKLGFDHSEIIEYALKRLQYKLEYTSVGLELLPEQFTLTQLQKIYETILDEDIDKRNFRKKIFSMDIVEETKEYKVGQHRPALLYKFKKQEPKSKFKRVKLEK